MCGGTGSAHTKGSRCPGLSPRVRGNRIDYYAIGDSKGSIPACAGEPALDAHGRRAFEVYPRVCGGTWGAVGVLGSKPGLSPRVRGNQTASCEWNRPRRSIPACAGEPWTPSGRRRARGVYPRVCGGTAFQLGADGVIEGLSPRVRGNRGWPRSNMGRRGSIPACAGEPHPSRTAASGCRVYPRVCGGTSSP